MAKNQAAHAGEDDQNDAPEYHEQGKVQCHVLDDLEHWPKRPRDSQFQKELQPSAHGRKGQDILERQFSGLHLPDDIDCVKLIIRPIRAIIGIIGILFARVVPPEPDPD